MQYFASILAYTGTVAGIQRKKKGNDQDLTKYLINDCSPSGLCMLFYGLQTVLSLAQSVPYLHLPSKTKVPPPPHKKGQTDGSLCICRDGSVSQNS